MIPTSKVRIAFPVFIVTWRAEIGPRRRGTLSPLRVSSNIGDFLDSKCSKFSEDEEEKMLARLGITYGVLRRLGFDEERVNQCLKTIGGVDLDTAYEWVIAIQSSASVN